MDKLLDLKTFEELAMGLLAMLLKAFNGSDFPDLEVTGDIKGDEDTEEEGLGVSAFLIHG
jgi:hypothetical protein